MTGLSFQTLRSANVERCEDAYHSVTDWSLTDWACAAAGEMGETCNVVKKLRRLSSTGDAAADLLVDVPEAGRLAADLADEIADTVIYLDLLAARAGIDLGLAVAKKFNATSERVGSAVRL